MHVTPSELRTLRQDGTLIQFALLESLAFVVVDLPSTGSSGTSIEQSCAKPHWGFVLDGDVDFESEDGRQTIPVGSAFHVPAGGAAHRFLVKGAARIAGFEPIDPVVDVSDAGLVARGFEVSGADATGSASIIPAAVSLLLEGSQIEPTTWPMSAYILTQARFGPGSGYMNDWCDVPHWGLVTAGRLAIEWENDIEIVSAGDIYHCPAGPPGHRLEAADPAGIIDLTPIAELVAATRVAPWREVPKMGAAATGDHSSIAVAGLG